VKAWTPYTRNGVPMDVSIPSRPDQIAAMMPLGAETRLNPPTGHTEWPDGRVHHCGFTTVLPPNTDVSYTVSGVTYRECDYNTWVEGRASAASPRPNTYAAVTSRSWHEAMVHAAFADGSVRSLSENIDLVVWRSMSTRSGGEQVEEF
jgi:hypothetical protein